VIKDDCADERLGNKWLEKMLEMFKFPDDSTKWKFVRKEIFEIFTNNGSSGNLARGSNKCFLSSILDEIKAELKEDSENNVLKECGTTYQTLINTGYFKINEPSIKEVQNESRKLIEEDIIP
jgi:predicted house-cleaning noncanonical NTP pyrophosphatase (MazG superfamily)